MAELKDAFNRGTACQIIYEMSYETVQISLTVTCSSV